MKKVIIGMPINAFDSHGKKRTALVTNVFGESEKLSDGTESHPAINVIFCSDDSAKEDVYGRQVERLTSLVYSEQQSAHGMYWSFIG
jgi:hypothetical protein